MITQRIYVDTSVIGGCYDDEFMAYSILLFDAVKAGKKRIIVSDIVLLELEGAPSRVKGILSDVPSGNIEYVFLDEEAIALANKYLKDGVIAVHSLSDARHIAVAVIARADVLVSWNFKHIVNLKRIHLINSVNLKMGYPMLEIRSPVEVIYED